MLGDSTFIHSGITGLIDIVYNRGFSTVIILDNRTTAMTGFQPHPGTGLTIRGEETFALDLAELARAVGVESVRVVDPWDLKELRKVLKEEVGADHSSVIVARRACVNRDREREFVLHTIDNEVCNECGLCMKLGCPAIVKRGDELFVDHAQCIGCTLCAQVCKKGAIGEVKDRG